MLVTPLEKKIIKTFRGCGALSELRKGYSNVGFCGGVEQDFNLTNALDGLKQIYTDDNKLFSSVLWKYWMKEND